MKLTPAQVKALRDMSQCGSVTVFYSIGDYIERTYWTDKARMPRPKEPLASTVHALAKRGLLDMQPSTNHGAKNTRGDYSINDAGRAALAALEETP